MGGTQYPLFWVERAWLKSDAWLDLSFSSRVVLIHFRAKCTFEKTGGRRSKNYRHKNNGELVFTYKEALAIGISSRTFSRVIQELKEHGFIKIEQRGFGGVGEFTATSQYALSEDWRGWRKTGGLGGDN